MNKFIIFIFASLIAGSAYAQSATTKEGGYAACLTEALLDDFVTFATAGDTANMNAYLQSQRCISLRGGITVTITERSGLLGAKVAFVFQGVKLWTVREALDRG